jgi:adhesin transport system membrane fusion protein
MTSEDKAQMPPPEESAKSAKPVRTAPLKDRTDLEFVSDLNAAILEQAPRGGRIVLWGAVLFLAFALLWANQAELDEVTRGSGKVIPSRQVQVIQNLEGGIVSEILAKEGEIVNPGQALLKIDDVRFSSSYRESHMRLLALQAKAERLKAEAADVPFEPSKALAKEQPEVVQRELELYGSRQQQQSATINILTQQVKQRQQELTELYARKGQLDRSYHLVLRELELTKPLVAQGAISEVEVLRLERTVNELKGELESTTLAIPKALSRSEEAQRKVEEAKLTFLNEVRSELNEITSEISRISESNTALKDRVQRTIVRSPVKGQVKRLLVNTVGGIIQPGMDIVEVVPLEDSLLVEARIRPSDIGFLHPGQRAVVKFSAYDFAIYGGLEGALEYISADSLTDEQGDPYYLVRVRTKKSFLGEEDSPLAIIPGMMAGVDILTGKKTVLEYLLKPVLRAKEFALTER